MATQVTATTTKMVRVPKTGMTKDGAPAVKASTTRARISWPITSAPSAEHTARTLAPFGFVMRLLMWPFSQSAVTRSTPTAPKKKAMSPSLKPTSAIGLRAARSIVSPGIASVTAISSIMTAMAHSNRRLKL
ncbi:hypothetical protein SAMN04487843_14417 [Methylobacterium sp. ap11]|nr:hypothetical protein SAMN04487843_14417 [Methylobacterium sp. ap11]